MKLRPRHVFATVMLVGTSPILAALVAGWAISAVIYGLARVAAIARPARRTTPTSSARGGAQHRWI